MITEPATAFSRVFRGYDPAAVDAYVEALLAKQKLLIDEVQNLRAQRNESGDQLAALRIEVACLKDEVAHLSDNSPTPYAIQHRMTKMLRRTLEEISRMQAEAQAEAESMIAAAAAQVEASHREHQELLADMAAQREALETEREEAKKELEAELATMRAEAQASIDEARQEAERECARLLAEAKQKADDLDERARRTVEEANQQRIMILEELMDVARDLQGLPASLESAYQERTSPSEASVVVPLDPKNQAPGPAVAS